MTGSSPQLPRGNRNAATIAIRPTHAERGFTPLSSGQTFGVPSLILQLPDAFLTNSLRPRSLSSEWILLNDLTAHNGHSFDREAIMDAARDAVRNRCRRNCCLDCPRV